MCQRLWKLIKVNVELSCRTVVHMVNLIKPVCFFFFNSCFIFGEDSGPLNGTYSTVFCVNEYRSPEKRGGFKQKCCHGRASRS